MESESRTTGLPRKVDISTSDGVGKSEIDDVRTECWRGKTSPADRQSRTKSPVAKEGYGGVGGVVRQGDFPTTFSGGRREGKILYAWCSKHGQLSGPGTSGCCVGPGGTTHAHTAMAEVCRGFATYKLEY